MPQKKEHKWYQQATRLFAAVFTVGMMWACANIGMPEGGPFDVTPPKLISASPSERSTNVKEQRISLYFDEFVKINGQDKIIISPPQRQQPIIVSRGKSIHVRLQDSLRPNTTYSLYFDDAIVDNNEDNPLERFAYTFSTGSTIDSMQIQGLVLDAETLEPVPNALVGAYYAHTPDSIVLKEAFPFAGKSNKLGQFTIRGLKDSVYRSFALVDKDNDNRFDGLSEGFAFDRNTYRTSKRDSMRTDTIKIDSIVRRDTLYRDSLVTYPYTYYYPNKVVLRYYTPESKQRGLQRHNRPDSLHFSLEFAEELNHTPLLRSLDKPNEQAQSLYLTERSGRTATYWLKDKDLISKDSIRFSLDYIKTDSLLKEHSVTDTLTLFKPKTKAEKSKTKQEPNPFKLEFTGAKGIYAGTPEDSLILHASLPIAELKSTHIRLEETRDSIYKPINFTLKQDSTDALNYNILFKRNYGASYRVRIDSAVVNSIYGHTSDSVAFTQSISKESELGHLQLSISGIQHRSFVQLLDKGNKVLMTREALLPQDTTKKADSVQKEQNLIVTFSDLKPDEYFVRLYIDSNYDGVWTTGDYPAREPEPMYCSPAKYPIKKSFTTAESWAPLSTPLEAQKPQELMKTKVEETKKRRENKNKEYYQRMQSKRKKKSS